ncbi:PTS glucose transporter subunit IIA [Miniimonas sp. S16]|uniref:PTS sugar transporter subunit IIA n=1 Tax=Miniimonas sp. S16 TaxID=2171623 RepID=UPI000D528D9F|nr:PTS glucose transporter subunit IIA [Miniimonas sp. S16]
MATTVLSPLAGRAVALADVPDPVFSQGIVGPGAAIDPTADVLDVVAPIAGTLVKVFPHAFVIAGADGVGVLVHLGIDTVKLDGEGFTVLVEQGSTVAAGDPVVIWDVPAIVAAGYSPVSPVIVMDRAAELVAVADGVEGAATQPGQPLLTVSA